MKRLLLFIFIPAFLAGCGSTAVDESLTVELRLSGDMLFEGSNTLQMPAEMSPAKIAEKLSVEVKNLKKIGVSKASLSMRDDQAAITESLLLQVVSNNKSLVTAGTLSPLTEDASSLDLNVAEDIDLLPYLSDEGCTWVLDLNLSEDFMDEMTVNGTLTLRVEYSE